LIKLQRLGSEIINKTKDRVSVNQMKDFLDLLIDVTNQNKAASIQVEDATRLVLTGIEFNGIDFGDYLSDLEL
jgi:hypothetical protein